MADATLSPASTSDEDSQSAPPLLFTLAPELLERIITLADAPAPRNGYGARKSVARAYCLTPFTITADARLCVKSP